MDNKKPNHFKKFKIAGFISLVLALVGVILVSINFGNFDNMHFFLIGGCLASFGFFVGIICLVLGFRPEISKLSTKTTKYIINENKEDLTEITNTSADIMGGAITKTSKAIKKGLDDEESIFCKHCGAKIDADSKFCNKCGKEQ